MYIKILSGIAVVLLIIVLTSLTLKLAKISESPLSFEDLDLLLDNMIEAGVATKAVDINDPLLKSRQIVISSVINEKIASEVVSKLLYLDRINNDSIFIFISSMGGFGYCAKMIAETFKLINSPVNTVVTGNCYSAGTIISVSATGKRYATSNSNFMIHANLNDTGEKINLYNIWYENIWKEHTEIPSEWFPMNRDKEYYFNSTDALSYKVIDGIIEKID